MRLGTAEDEYCISSFELSKHIEVWDAVWVFDYSGSIKAVFFGDGFDGAECADEVEFRLREVEIASRRLVRLKFLKCLEYLLKWFIGFGQHCASVDEFYC